MNQVSQIPIVGSVAPIMFVSIGLLCVAWLAWGSRRHVTRILPVLFGVVALATWVFWYVAEGPLSLWGEPLPAILYVYAGAGVFTLALAIRKICSQPHLRGRVITATTALVAVIASAGLINQEFEYYPTLGSIFGDAGVKIRTLAEFHHIYGSDNVPREAAPTSQASWQAPENMPAHGEVLQVHIPGAASHESTTDAYVYLPPAYLVSKRVNLPVIVLIHGVPGGYADWVRGGQINKFMDKYAAAHDGFAPVVVMPDAGANMAHYPPLCMNSQQGQGATYLTEDVPNWVKRTFGAGTSSPRQWAIGGFSYGGTCAMTLAVNHPEVYPTFIDSSGESRPNIKGGKPEVIKRYFGNDPAEFAHQNALDVLKTRRYPGVEGIVTVGREDKAYRKQGIEVFQAMKNAGMSVRLQEAPGGHAWPAWRYGIHENMDWLMRRLLT